MKNIINFLCIVLLSCVVIACQEREYLPISGSVGKPDKVTDVAVKSVPGGAVINYKVPNDNNILGVKAVFQRNGKKVETLVSFYDNILNIEGFVDNASHLVQLITVNRALEESEPVEVSFTPLEAPINIVKRSVQISPDFGGPRFQWVNEHKSPLTFEMFTPDSLGRLSLSKVLVSSSAVMQHTIRGYQADEIPVAMVIHDRFGNISDTIYPPGKKIVPLFEEKISKNNMSIVFLDNDADFGLHDGRPEYVIDDDENTFGHTNNNTLPSAITIDMGRKVKMSRFVITNRNYWGHAFSWGNIRTFEVYGRVDAPSKNGDWSEWTRLLDPKDCEIIKPSGRPGTDVTPEDITYGLNFEFDVPFEIPTFRYFRLVVHSTWSMTTFTHPAEITFYGSTNF